MYVDWIQEMQQLKQKQGKIFTEYGNLFPFYFKIFWQSLHKGDSVINPFF